MIQDTSLEAYFLLESDLGRMQSFIFNIIREYPDVSNLDIARITGKPINSVTPRVKELRDKGLVFFNGYKIDRITKRRVMCWSVLNK